MEVFPEMKKLFPRISKQLENETLEIPQFLLKNTFQQVFLNFLRVLNGLFADHKLVFNNICDTHPLIFFIDDIHCADFSSVHLLKEIFEKLTDVPVFVIVSLRTDIPDENSGFSLL